MTNILQKDANSVVYEGVRNPAGPSFVAKLGTGFTWTDGDGIASMAQAVGGINSEIAGQGTGVVNAINTDLFPSVDVSGYKWVSLQIEGTYSGTLSFQGSNDNVNFHSATLWDSSQTGSSGPSNSTTSSGKIWFGPLNYRYFRVRMTSFTSNTSLAGVLELYTMAPGPLPASSYTNPTSPTASSNQNGTNDYHVISAATTNTANIKASGGVVYGYDIGNSGTTDAWVKLFNKASAPTLGTDLPLRTIYAPKGTSTNFNSGTGINFSNGIAIAITGAATDTDATAVTVNVIQVDIDWK